MKSIGLICKDVKAHAGFAISLIAVILMITGMGMIITTGEAIAISVPFDLITLDILGVASVASTIHFMKKIGINL